jgi:hypothetical protein
MEFVIALVGGFFLGLLVSGGWRHRRKHRIVSGQLFVAPIGDDMAKSIFHADDNGFSAAVVYKDKKGNVSLPASPPVWTTSIDGIVNLTVAADGMSATGTFTGQAGDLTLDVVAEGDPTPGVDTVHSTADISVLPAEIATGEITIIPTP